MLYQSAIPLSGEAMEPIQESKYQQEFPALMKLPIPPGVFAAYLFDCDGTIVDSMPLHYIAWKAALAEYGCVFPEELFYSWGGKPVAEIISTLNAMNGLHMHVEQVGIRKEGLYFDMLPQLTAIAEVVEHIHAQHGKIPLAVVSGGRRESVTRSLQAVGLLKQFETIVAAEDYVNSKPAPDAFLLAAKRLGVVPADCLVFEDTELGLQAATAAGMASVRVPSPLERMAAIS
jgi:HAD superfamily hydrolase (TIGR01509 family)